MQMHYFRGTLLIGMLYLDNSVLIIPSPWRVGSHWSVFQSVSVLFYMTIIPGFVCLIISDYQMTDIYFLSYMFHPVGVSFRLLSTEVVNVVVDILLLLLLLLGVLSLYYIVFILLLFFVFCWSFLLLLLLIFVVVAEVLMNYLFLFCIFSAIWKETMDGRTSHVSPTSKSGKLFLFLNLTWRRD